MSKMKFSPNYRAPFNTGKVRIGLAYTRPQRNYMQTEEDMFWQKILLKTQDGLFVGPIPLRWYLFLLGFFAVGVTWVTR